LLAVVAHPLRCVADHLPERSLAHALCSLDLESVKEFTTRWPAIPRAGGASRPWHW